MKTVIGHARCTKRPDLYSTIYCRLDKETRDFLNCKYIVFNPETLIFRRAGIDDKKVHCIGSETFTFTPKYNYPNILGNYKVIQKDEDTFILKRLKDA